MIRKQTQLLHKPLFFNGLLGGKFLLNILLTLLGWLPGAVHAFYVLSK